jgi:3,4-dihydroxy 2-butanone 4-phosphate synthase/GTP cyclohydrolase II
MSSQEAPPRTLVRRAAHTVLPTDEARFDAIGYVDEVSGDEHVALVLGDPASDSPSGAPLVRLHSECLTGDALGSHRCDCGDQLAAARRQVAAAGRGIVVYLCGHEGRGIGLADKLRAYALQDRGLDTVDANLALGLPVDSRRYGAAAAILADLGVTSLRLMSSNPAKEAALSALGLEVVDRQPLVVPDRPEARGYLSTKRVRMGHDAPVSVRDAVWRELLRGRVPQGVVDPESSALVDRYAPLVANGSALVVGQLGQSLDGFIAARTGDAVFVTGEADREHLHRLRALVDAVVVGVGTVIADDPQLTVRAVEGRSPVRVLLDPAGRAPAGATLLREGVAPVLWCVAEDAVVAAAAAAAHVEVVRLPHGPDGFAPGDVLAALAARGLRRVLVEGGGRTVSGFLAAGVLDRMFVTTAPLLVGDGVPGLRFMGTDRLADALRAPSRRFVLDEDVCMELDLAAVRRGADRRTGRTEVAGLVDVSA